MTAKQSLTRLRILGLFFGLLCVILVYRLYSVQIVNGSEFRRIAGSQHIQTSSTDYDRGTIYIKDRVGDRFPVANVSSGYVLTINPNLVTNPDEIGDSIFDIIQGNKGVGDRENFMDDFIKKATKENDPYEVIANRITADQAERISELDIIGVQSYPERWRYYPAGSMLSTVIGFTSYDGDDRVGTYGLERKYEDQLNRKQTSIFTNLFAEAFSTAKKAADDQLASDLHLTIDRSVQIELEKTIRRAQETWKTTLTGGIVMDPKTGAIIAMATTPTFNLNYFSEVSNPSLYSNPLVENVYEMGSIMKPLTMAYALDAGAISQNTHFNDTGSLKVDGSTISNFDGDARGNVPVQEILNQSLNVGTAFLMRSMGSKVFKEYFIKSGLNEQTKIDLPNEARPLTSSLLSSPRQIEYVTASFGQGFAVSPIAMTRALAIIANQGRLPSPYVVERIQHDLGTWTDNRKKSTTQVISEKSAEITTRMMVNTVDDALRGGSVSLENYSIAAKTGTAQIANTTGQYREDVYLHTFFGYFPAYDPKYVIFLMNEQPRGAQYASETLTDPFMLLTKFLINYQNLEPDR